MLAQLCGFFGGLSQDDDQRLEKGAEEVRMDAWLGAQHSPLASAASLGLQFEATLNEMSSTLPRLVRLCIWSLLSLFPKMAKLQLLDQLSQMYKKVQRFQKLLRERDSIISQSY